MTPKNDQWPRVSPNERRGYEEPEPSSPRVGAQELRKLVRKWRESAEQGDGPTDRFIGFELCADDLEATLAALAPTQPQPSAEQQLAEARAQLCPCCDSPIAAHRPKYDKAFGDDRLCNCGHVYYRHFDSYQDMRPIGCKYCTCDRFYNPEPRAGRDLEGEQK